MDFPVLFKMTSTGAIQTWHIWTDEGTIYSEYGLLGGKTQTATDVLTEGKNAGKVNETTVEAQAAAEAKSRWTKKKQKHYVESREEAEGGQVDTAVVQGGVAPMLAHQYDKQGHKIKFPAFVQPKLDGHRCIAVVQDGKCTLWSRTQKRITGVPHIERAIEQMCGVQVKNVVLDGELYNHDYKDKFEQLSSHIQQEKPRPGSEVVQFWMYDVAIDALSFEERFGLLKSFSRLIDAYGLKNTLKVLWTFTAHDEEEMVEQFGAFLGQGYEGAIVRNAKGLYEHRRSYGLQKVKIMQDAEYEIVDVEEGRGKMAGKAIFVCKTAKGDLFACKMMGSLDKLAEIWLNRDEYIGKTLTVKYQDMSAYGIPRFPVGVRLREDL